MLHLSSTARACSFALMAAVLSASLLGCVEEPLLSEVTINFSPPPASLVGAVVNVEVLRDSGAGLELVQTIEEEVDEEVSGVRFEIRGEDPPLDRYVMRVHVDLDADGTRNAGDYESSDVDVFQGTYPESLTVTVTPVEN